MIARIHHCMIDGTSGVELGMLLFDLTADAPEDESEEWSPEPAPAPWRILTRALGDRTDDAIRNLGAVARAVRDPRMPVSRALKFARAMETIARPCEPLPFNARVGPRRAFATAEIPLEAVLETRRAFGATVNDVALAAVSGALRRY